MNRQLITTTARLAAALVLAALAAPARAEARFTQDAVISSDSPETARVALDASTTSKVDLAWVNKDGSTVFLSRTVGGMSADRRATTAPAAQPATQPSTPETVCGLTHALYGIRRSGDTVRVGVNSNRRLMQWTRGADGKWASSDAGVEAIAYYGQIGGYDVQPKSGLGGFVVTTADKKTVLALETQPGTWKLTTLAEQQQPNTRASFAFTPKGEPVPIFQVLGEPRSAIRAGKPEDPGSVESSANAWYPLAAAGDARGGLHAVVSLHSGTINYYRSRNGGALWMAESQVARSSSYGDAATLQVAVDARGEHLAALVPTGVNGLMLATSADGGQKWATQELPGGKTQWGALAFDPAGTLHVFYFNTVDMRLHLLSGSVAADAARRR